jgi:hypothetical protein
MIYTGFIFRYSYIKLKFQHLLRLKHMESDDSFPEYISFYGMCRYKESIMKGLNVRQLNLF